MSLAVIEFIKGVGSIYGLPSVKVLGSATAGILFAVSAAAVPDGLEVIIREGLLVDLEGLVVVFSIDLVVVGVRDLFILIVGLVVCPKTKKGTSTRMLIM